MQLELELSQVLNEELAIEVNVLDRVLGCSSVASSTLTRKNQ